MGGKYYGAGKFQASSNVGQASCLPAGGKAAGQETLERNRAGWKRCPTLRRQFFAVRRITFKRYRISPFLSTAND
jgi:hypothetical protein